MKNFSVGLALLALLGSIPAAWAGPSAPPSRPTALVPLNPEGLGFELRLPEGKTRFQQGETIPIRLIFSNRGPQTLCLDTFYYSPPSMAVFATFAVSPQDGATTPFGDLPPETAFSYNGPGPARPRILSDKPTEVTLVLNEYVRFDRPGTFQIRATTNHVFAVAKGQPAPSEGSFFGRGESVSSSPLSIEIVPADPKWQQDQVKAWHTFWAKQKPGSMEWDTPPGVQRPANDLRFLNTRPAAQAIIERLGQDEFPRSSGSESYFWRSGLIGVSDRFWLIGAMKEAMRRPNYPVTQGFLDNLATLQALYHVARPKKETPNGKFWKATEKASLANWQGAFAALTSKQGRARAMTIHSLLESGWESRFEKAPEIKARLDRLVEMVPAVFKELPPLPQQYLLDDSDSNNEWKRVKNPRFVGPLVREWKTVPHSEGWEMERGDLILRHIYELDSKVGRALILQEMGSSQPRASFEVLSLLNDRYLPQLQNIWWTHLNSNEADQDMAALLIGRYATPALKTKVQKEYAQRKRDNLLSFDVNRGLRRYLAKVAG
ncbi:hypothetical protein IAD21_01292 [Abditibacteriota bacterium]|nr:hypothetical protein IAD21_01292 [Abditibacteriota bacterium]